MPRVSGAPSLASPGVLAGFIQRVPLLADMPDAARQKLLLSCRLDTFQPPAIIFRQGDAADRLWIVAAGEVKIVRQDESGREIILEVITPGEVFGGAAIFLPEHPATAQPLTPSAETVSFPSEAYARALAESPATALKVIRMLGQRLHSTLKMNQLAGERVERRMAFILLKMAGVCGQPDPEGTLLTVPLTRQDLADMAGTTIETAIRMMSRFQTEGLVATRKGGFLVLRDEERLKAIARA
jgi:CRP/FNR family transcriptional regulator